ncbi:MAG: sulfatase-like hydrolase/transferase, partial [Xanthomonadales bacterium]|nr:sulfatase-like hydrolase/transferase [Xanthomonadales bacterium]
MLTVDTHHPRGDPSDSCKTYAAIDNSVLHAVHCTDQLIGRLTDKLKSHPAYEDTVVVILADHLAMRNDAFPLFPEGYKRSLYFNVLNSRNSGSTDAAAMPTDVAPTVLSLLGVEHNTSFLAGADIS